MKRDVMMKFKRAVALVAIVPFIIVLACSDDSGNENKDVNDWIYANMEYAYLWNTDIPGNPNRSQNPKKFFNSLLSEEDRFSWIEDNYIDLVNSLNGVNKEAGYEFKLYKRLNSDDVIAQVMYIKEGSLIDTENKDLMRGDIITHINGEKMTLSNYVDVLDNIYENHTIRYNRMIEGTEVDQGTLSLNTSEFAENPNFMSKVIETDGHKIGYYVYNFFAVGPNSNSEIYNQQMDAIMADFKAASITDLVIDLRYNSGGAESATINLASLIGKNIDNTKIFTRRQFNDEVQDDILRDPRYGPDYLNKKFLTKTANVGSILPNGRIYILTSGRTASASELLINGLRPFMDVFLVGDTTVGKNVASVTIIDQNNPKNKWGMQPIVSRSYNSLNQSDYDKGFVPDILELDNNLEIMPLGDENELLLSLAINHITGGSSSRQDFAVRKRKLKPLGSSADFRHGSYNLVIDDKPFRNLVKLPVIE